MKNRTGLKWTRRCAAAAVLAALWSVAARADDAAVVGRLTDVNGAAVAGAMVTVCPALGRGASSDRLSEVCDPALLRSDADGAFAIQLPPGRYLVAVMKSGYDVLFTEAQSLASRVLRLRMQRAAGAAGRPPGADSDWLIRAQQGDILRDLDAAPPLAIALLQDDGGAPGTPGGATRPRHGVAADLTRAFFSQVNGDVMQSFTAGDLASLGGEPASEAGRLTAGSVSAPVGERSTWAVEGRSSRSRSALPGSGDLLTGGSDRLLLGATYAAAPLSPLSGQIQAGFGDQVAGGSHVGDRLLHGSGAVDLPDRGTSVQVGVNAWSTGAELARGGYLSLDPRAGDPGAARPGDGLSLYAAERRPLRSAQLEYGFEVRDSTLEGGRVVPRFAVATGDDRTLPIEVRTELVLDPANPGGRIAFAGRASSPVRWEASVSVVPASAWMSGVAEADPTPLSWGGPAAGLQAADLREVAVSISGDLGPLSGSMSGSVGRSLRRDVPVVRDGPVPIVSLGDERFYETRFGVAYRPWDTRMEIGYRRVASDAGGAPAASDPLDYRLVDLVVSQDLPAVKLPSGARLRALVAWQGMGYDAQYVAPPGGQAIAGSATRLSGGVGLTF